MFIFQKIIGQCISLTTLILTLSITGLILLWHTSKQKIGIILISLGVTILAFCSYVTISDVILISLENKYPTIRDDAIEATPNINAIVVLGAGHNSSHSFPITSRISSESLTRLIEGVRIYRKVQGSKLLLSGGNVIESISEAEAMAQVAISIGVNEKDIIIESRSSDTYEQSVILHSMLGKAPFILVTSASHMPRAMALFRKLDMIPLPAPTMHLVDNKHTIVQGLFVPLVENLRKSEVAFYEYMAIFWLKLRGHI
ncbi:hypothetical protein C4544_07300 [candidate division WS5 bacterium]|uniref:DUF218 domain-containing protein n=1 Tax=candidate division WS5 bacterium TaxID=2093353 RepID=A0A419DA25_9BACT|nr:MAG: hypothetical protein C4544_07300 [candidate division WS5 bacterium]